MIYQELNWSKSEKKIARNAFDLAYQREMAKIKEEISARVSDFKNPEDIWDLDDYLHTKRKEIFRKYDYRYSSLIMVFAQLVAEGFLFEDDLKGIHEEKLEIIKRFSININED